jgi:eukaryotic-like serine/threonine-protein kinase
MNRILVVLGALVAAFTLGIGLFNFVIMPRLVQHNVTVRVPEVVGLDESAAEKRCTQLGLNWKVEQRRASPGVPIHQVLSQSPEPGTAVKPGRTVRVHVSSETQQVAVPELRGMSLRQASVQLENTQLVLGRVSRIYAGDAGQVVLASRPRAGAGAVEGARVDVLVSVGEGTEPYLMPSLLGRPLEEVRNLIESRGFRVGRVTYRSRRGVYPGTVLEHYPASGALILRGESIDLVAAAPE